MNDLEHEVSTRLHTLADHLAPDADPYAQAGGAQTLHRRRRRTRIGLAGLAAVTALVVVGVPLGIGALSSAPDSQVAAPSPTEAAPVLTGNTSLSDLTVLLRTELGDDASVAAPDLSASERARISGRSCPDTTDVLSARVGVPVTSVRSTDPPAATVGGRCSWSSAIGKDADPTQRLDLSLWLPGPATDVRIMRSDSAPEGCLATTLPEQAPVNSSRSYVSLCRGDADPAGRAAAGQVGWNVTLPDGSGELWVLTAAVGNALPARTGVDAIVALRDVVQEELAINPQAAFDTGVAAAEEMAARIAELSPNLSLSTPSHSDACPDAGGLERYGVQLQPGGSATAGCLWSTGAGQSPTSLPLSASARYYADAFPPVRSVGCPSASVPASATGARVQVVCATGADGRSGGWKLAVPDADGSGGWLLFAAGGLEARPDGKTTIPPGDDPTPFGLLPALVQVADGTW